MTETPNGQPPSRLDRIESILLQAATSINQLATNQAETDYRLNQVTDRLDRTADQFQQLVTQQVATDTRLDRVTERLDRVAAQQETADHRLTELTYKVDDFISTANSVLARTAIVDGMVFELREVVVRLDANAERMEANIERMQANFEENQRSTNAALERLESILIRLIDKGDRNGDSHL